MEGVKQATQLGVYVIFSDLKCAFNKAFEFLTDPSREEDLQKESVFLNTIHSTLSKIRDITDKKPPTKGEPIVLDKESNDKKPPIKDEPIVLDKESNDKNMVDSDDISRDLDSNGSEEEGRDNRYSDAVSEPLESLVDVSEEAESCYSSSSEEIEKKRLTRHGYEMDTFVTSDGSDDEDKEFDTRPKLKRLRPFECESVPVTSSNDSNNNNTNVQFKRIESDNVSIESEQIGTDNELRLDSNLDIIGLGTTTNTRSENYTPKDGPSMPETCSPEKQKEFKEVQETQSVLVTPMEVEQKRKESDEFQFKTPQFPASVKPKSNANAGKRKIDGGGGNERPKKKQRVTDTGGVKPKRTRTVVDVSIGDLIKWGCLKVGDEITCTVTGPQGTRTEKLTIGEGGKLGDGFRSLSKWVNSVRNKVGAGRTPSGWKEAKYGNKTLEKLRAICEVKMGKV